ncbi:hypothetical protein, partial [Enterobacter asburiae]|uniref:hypothetical protein n=1 Tax=Enterobacter asburiae TaxID=61645 RepID=UPI001F17B892
LNPWRFSSDTRCTFKILLYFDGTDGCSTSASVTGRKCQNGRGSVPKLCQAKSNILSSILTGQ